VAIDSDPQLRQRCLGIDRNQQWRRGVYPETWDMYNRLDNWLRRRSERLANMVEDVFQF
jgi:hypothetical protein